MYLENINSPQDVKKLDFAQLEVLAAEMREALLKRLSVHGGHFGPNMGFVEATVALHYVFDSPEDKIVFDVSHQCYPHKMLTGRKDAYLDPAKYDDVTGYTNPLESEHDMFNIGHTSTSVSLACGLAKGRELCGGKENIIAVIGDGSLSGGEALEGLDFAGEQSSNMIILVNDNDMSIAENHGGIYKNLRMLRESSGKCECNLFRSMGLDYKFEANGNDIQSLIKLFESVKDIDHPVVLHIVTEKGKGKLLVEWPMDDGRQLTILLSEEGMEIAVPGKGPDWMLELTAAPGAALPFTAFGARRVTAAQKGFAYAFDCTKGTIATDGTSAESIFVLHPSNGKISLKFK